MRQYTIQAAIKEYRATKGYCANGTPLRSWVNFCLGEKEQPKLLELEASQIPGLDDKWQAPRRPNDFQHRIIPREECMRGYGDHEGEGTQVGPFHFAGPVPDATAALAQDRADVEAELSEVEALEASAKKLGGEIAHTGKVLRSHVQRRRRIKQNAARLNAEIKAHGGWHQWSAARRAKRRAERANETPDQKWLRWERCRRSPFYAACAAYVRQTHPELFRGVLR